MYVNGCVIVCVSAYVRVHVCKSGHVRLCVSDWFGLVSLFNGISTFVGYLMPKLSLKNSSEAI